MAEDSSVILIRLRERKGKTQEEVAEEMETSQTVISRHERGKPFGRDMLERYASYYGVSTDVILGKATLIEKEVQPPHISGGQRKVPIVGTISCGEPLLAVEEYEDFLELPSDLIPSGPMIALRMTGDSMVNARLHNGDLALIHLQETVEDGEIAAVCVGDSTEEATIKKVRFLDGFVSLVPQSDNPAYRPLAYRPEQVRVVGKVMGVWWG